MLVFSSISELHIVSVRGSTKVLVGEGHSLRNMLLKCSKSVLETITSPWCSYNNNIIINHSKKQQLNCIYYILTFDYYIFVSHIDSFVLRPWGWDSISVPVSWRHKQQKIRTCVLKSGLFPKHFPLLLWEEQVGRMFAHTWVGLYNSHLLEISPN